MSMLTRIRMYPLKSLRNIKMAICNYQVDSHFYLWPAVDVCPGD